MCPRLVNVRWTVSLFGNLFGRKDRSNDKIREAEGFRIATRQEIWGEVAGLREQADKARTPEAILAYADAAKAAIARNATLPWGTKVAAASHYWINDCGELSGTAAANAYVAPFEEAYRQRPEPYTAVLLAEACFNVSDSVRGGDWIDNTDEAALDLAHEWNVRGYEALSAQADAVKVGQGGTADPQHYPWYAQYYISATRLTRSLEDLVAAFNQVFALDPTNLQLLREHGQELLPRWRGEDESTLEEFARWAMEATKQTYGRGAYAYIYGNLANIGELDSEDTAVNVELLDAGYRDLLERHPCIRLQNEQANVLSWADAESRVLAVFNNGLRAIDYSAWGGDDEAEGMEYALNAYSFARDNG